MTFTHSPLVGWLYGLVCVTWLLLVAVSIRTIWRYRLHTIEIGQHLFFGNAIGLVLLWQLCVPFSDGMIRVHFLALGAAWLMLGEAMCWLVVNLVVGVLAWRGAMSWTAVPVNALLAGLALLPPVFLRGWLSGRPWSNPLVFIWLNGFLGSILGIVVVLLCGMALAALALPDPGDNLGLLLPYAILLGFGEGFLNGTLATALVVFVPGWLYSMRGLPEL